MGDIIKVKNSSYSLYEEMLMRRDNLKKEAFIYQRNYVAEFGDLILEVFKKKVDCIRKKKTIEFCQRSLNHGKLINHDELQMFLQKEMEEFQKKLDYMIEDTALAKKRKQITELDLLKIKKIYHKLVKLIHPDINPMTNENKQLAELWEKVQVAYRCNDLKGMEESEILVTAVLEQLEIGKIEVEIPNIDVKIAELEAEITKICETDPYMYKYLLENPESVKEKKYSLGEELKSYEDYSKQLDEVINGLMANGVTFKWRMN
ncbi:MAG: hypothetical protein ACI4EW_02210 [Butyrivibrio sp.]